MKTLSINLQNCFGIGQLVHSIQYKKNDNTAIVYAPNGTMKTSLTKTIQSLLDGKQPSDEMYPERVSQCDIKIDNISINKDIVYIFKNDNTDGTDNISTFLANDGLKREYDTIFSLLSKAKDSLKRELKAISKSTDCENEILKAFSINSDESYFDCLVKIKNEVDNNASVLTQYDFKYNDLFDKDEKIKQFISNNITDLQDYFDKYQTLVENSNVFSSGQNPFGTTQAMALLKSVDDDRYFGASHKLLLRGSQEIESSQQMKITIESEITRILSDPELKQKFENIDRRLQANASLKNFKEILEKYPDLVPELINYEELRKKIIRGYLVRSSGFNEMVDLYQANFDALRGIINRAKTERSQWEAVIEMFNSRFFVPFKLDLQNKADILLSDNNAELIFIYKDGDDETEIIKDRNELIEHLSRGEQKAFFILQNIFEIEARKAKQQQTLLVFDDVADSFDYKNKYAIIEYLSDIAEDPNFTLLILTHNFDFYRTIVSRLRVGSNIFFAHKSKERNVELKLGIYNSDILKNKFLNHLENVRAFIGSIPFIRNLIEYTKGHSDDDYKKLTACLHQKIDTKSITMSELFQIYKRTINIDEKVNIEFGDNFYLDSLYSEAQMILSDDNEVDLVNKLILSMAIRLKAETYMDNVLNDQQKGEMKQNYNQTGEFVRVFKKYHLIDKANEYKLMNRVLMLTSENIHLNNFMFEPLVDISILYLKRLYEEVDSFLIRNGSVHIIV